MGDPEHRGPAARLPRPLSSFVGREQEITRISSTLRQKNVRLLTLTGPAGIGKTRLGIETALTLRTDFRDGVWFADFASLNEPDLVAQAIALAIGVREEQGHSLLSTLLDALASRELLLVLDNCEHLIGPCARISEQLLGNCHDLQILATSRLRLGIPGEMTWLVQPLPVPDARRPLRTEQLTDYEAVRLFIERAYPALNVTEENLPTIAQICHHLDGIPLAIELAAAWVTTLTVEQIVDRLDDRIHILSSHSRYVSARQQTLRGAIEWSYDLLSDDERTLFNRLSVFAGGCMLASIEAVCASDESRGTDVLLLLDRLVDQSLVIAEDAQKEKRYRVLETLRLYGRERLVIEGEAEAARQRHAEHYLALSEAAEPQLWGPNLAAWMDRLEIEHDNLRAVLRWAAGRGEADIAQRLGATLCRFWRVRGHASEGRRWLDNALAWNGGSSSATRARALEAAGHLARDQHDYEGAGTYYESCLNIRREAGDKRGVALMLNSLGIVAQFQGEHELASTRQQESLSIFRQLNDREGIALSLITLGTLSQLQGHPEHATTVYEEGLALFRELGNKHGIAASLNNLGNLASARRDYASANALYEESMALFHELGDDYEVAACLSNLAGVAREQGAESRAVALYRDSLRIFAIIGHKYGIASCMAFLAVMAIRQSETARAAQLFAAAESIQAAVETTGTAGSSPNRDHLLATLQALLGNEGFNTMWETGRGLSLNEAVALALTDSDSETAAPAPDVNPLTPRQQEVATLVAHGLTNREIAGILFIAERTVDTHIEHILSRLDVRSRAQIAAWVVAH